MPLFRTMALNAIKRKENFEKEKDLVATYKNRLEAGGQLLTAEETSEMVMGITNPFRAIGSAKNFLKLYSHHIGKTKLSVTDDKVSMIMDRLKEATGASPGILFKFAKQKISGARQSIASNRKIVKRVQKETGIEDWRGSRPPHGRIFGGWRGGTQHEVKKSLTMQDFDNILREVLYK